MYMLNITDPTLPDLCDLDPVVVQVGGDGHEEPAGQPVRYRPSDSGQRGGQVGNFKNIFPALGGKRWLTKK
jgi:hypothetical protein